MGKPICENYRDGGCILGKIWIDDHYELAKCGKENEMACFKNQYELLGMARAE
jgi:hypothetical protein